MVLDTWNTGTLRMVLDTWNTGTLRMVLDTWNTGTLRMVLEYVYLDIPSMASRQQGNDSHGK